MTAARPDAWELHVRRTIELAERAELVALVCVIILACIAVLTLLVPDEPQYMGLGFFGWPVLTTMIACHTFTRGVERACVAYQSVVELQKQAIALLDQKVAQSKEASP